MSNPLHFLTGKTSDTHKQFSTEFTSNLEDSMLQKAQAHLFEIIHTHELDEELVLQTVLHPIIHTLYNNEQIDFAYISFMIDETGEENLIYAKKELLEQAKVIEFLSKKVLAKEQDLVWNLDFLGQQVLA
jgi:hypothetical protein